MRIAFILLPALLISSALLPTVPARAEPALLLEDAKLEPVGGAPEGGFGRATAVDGDVAVVTANIGSLIIDTGIEEKGGAAYVFERQANGEWRQTAKLLPDGASGLFGHSVAVEGGVIAVGAPFAARVYVFENSGAGWVRTAVLEGPGFGLSVAIENGIIATGSDNPHGMRLFGRASNGWTQIATFANGGNAGGSEYRGPHVDITGSHAIHGSPGDNTTDPELPELVYIYRRPPGGDWSAASVTAIGPANISRYVKISGDTALIGGAIYERDAAGWHALNGEVAYDIDADIDGSLTVGTIGGVRQRTAAGEWPAVAQLIAGDGSRLGLARISGRRAISNASHRLAAYVHDIPTTGLERAELQQDDFQDGNANGWSPTSGSFSVVDSTGSLVYRQASTAGNATSLLPAAFGTDQTVQADIRPVSFNGADRWFGLAVRYSDANNHYYVTARSSNVIQLKKIVGGTVQTLAAAALSIATDRTYRLRLEAIGPRLRLLVDDQLLLEARDASLPQGQPAVLMYKTAADYDNVLWGGNPLATLYRNGFEPDSSADSSMTVSPPGWRVVPIGSGHALEFPLTDGAASATGIGPLSANESANVTARATAFNGADRWFGLAVRYVDSQNYHYLTVRNSNTVMLRKLVNGAIQTLDSAPFPVATNQWYRLRIDIVGQSIRGYIDGKLVLEAEDPDLLRNDVSNGSALVLYKTAAQYDNLLFLRP